MPRSKSPSKSPEREAPEAPEAPQRQTSDSSLPEKVAASPADKRSASPERKRSKSPRRSRSRSPRKRSRSRSRSPRRRRSRSPARGGGFNRHKRGPSPEPTHILGVFGLSNQTDERDLRNVFEKFGRIDKCQLIYDKQTQRSRGFAFIYYDDVKSCTAAKEECNGMMLDHRSIRTDYSKTKGAHAPTPGQYLGRPTDRRSPPRYRSDDRGYGRGRSPRRRSRSPRRDRDRDYGRRDDRDRDYGRRRGRSRSRSRSRGRGRW